MTKSTMALGETPVGTEGRDKSALLIEIVQDIRAKRFTREKFESIADKVCSPGTTVRDLIEASFDFGNVVWEDNKIIFISARASNQK